MQIAEFFASLRIKPDQQSIHRADRWLKTFEKRLQRSARRVEKSNVLGTMLGLNEKRVARQAQRTLDVVSKTAVFRIQNFKINTKRIQQSLNTILNNNRTPLTINNFRINRASLRKQLEMAAGSFEIPVKFAPSRTRTPRGQGTVDKSTSRVSSGRGSSRRGRFSLTPRGVGIGVGGVGIFGGLGISALNRKMGELEMLPVMMESVTGSKASAQRELAFLNDLGNLVGAPTTELASDYTKILASAMGTPLEGKIQSGFASLTKYGKVMGLDSQSMKLSFRAFSQMIGKQQIMAEELKNQAAEHLPGIVRIMADVAAGGDTKKLFKMMESGQLDPNKYLPLLFEELEARAAGGWSAYTNTTRYQQNQTTKRFEDMIKMFAGSGGNEGFFRIWKAFADTLPQMDNVARSLGSTFNWFGERVQGSMNILTAFDSLLGSFTDLHPKVQDGLMSLAAAWLMFGTKVGRAMAPIIAGYLILQDISTHATGGDSVTGRIIGNRHIQQENIQAGIPAKLSSSIYAGPSHSWKNRLEKGIPQSFGEHALGAFSTTMMGLTQATSAIGDLIMPPMSAEEWQKRSLSETLTPDALARAQQYQREAAMKERQHMVTYAGFPESSNNNTINIYPKQGEEDVYRALDERLGTSLNNTLVNLPVGEGGG